MNLSEQFPSVAKLVRSRALNDSSVDDSHVIDTTPLDYTNLIGVDSFVAIKPSSDAIYSFFVLHVTSSGVYMNWKKTPDHSMVTHIWLAQKDSFFYQKTTREGHLYKEDTKTEAIIPQECVVYGIDIQPS